MPFYVGVTLESLQIDSTDQGWEVQPSPRSGPLSSSREAAADSTGGEDGGVASAGPPSGEAASGAQKGAAVAGDSCGDHLVKKNLQLTQLAVYWNPAEDGNPCSMHLSDIPVEQAEVVISRREEATSCYCFATFLRNPLPCSNPANNVSQLFSEPCCDLQYKQWFAQNPAGATVASTYIALKGHPLDCFVPCSKRLARCEFWVQTGDCTRLKNIRRRRLTLSRFLFIVLSLGARNNPVFLLSFCRCLCPRRLIARKDEVDALGAGEGAAGGSGKMRHRYLLEPVDASARVALSVDPMDR